MVKITTLGDFDITVDDISIMDEIGNSQRIIKLFKYFLIHKDTKLLPENIIDDLWSDEEFKNPINMLRTQISRLRKILDVDKINVEPFFNIKYINGYYVLNLEDYCQVDFIEFEKILEKDIISIKGYIERDYLKFRDVILSYKGKLFAEMGNEYWLIPIMSRFERLYVKALSYYIDYLKENLMYTEIIEICEKAINIQPYEEIIHLNFMEALINLKQHSYALIHYEFFTRRLFNDLGVVPSKKLTELYKKIKQKEDNPNSSIDLNKIDDEMSKEFNLGGVVFCDAEHFKFLYNYEKRNKNRRVDKSIGVGIGIVTLYSRAHTQLSKKEIKKAMDLLGYVLFKSFRYGDVVSKWNDNQMIILLYGLRQEHIKIVVDKINNNFNEAKSDDKLTLNIKLNIL